MSGGRRYVNPFGGVENRPDVSGMLAPMQCGWCGQVYDAGPVTVIARYADCSMWKAPCCGITADDRQFVGHPTAIRLNRDGSRR